MFRIVLGLLQARSVVRLRVEGVVLVHAEEQLVLVNVAKQDDFVIRCARNDVRLGLCAVVKGQQQGTLEIPKGIVDHSLAVGEEDSALAPLAHEVAHQCSNDVRLAVAHGAPEKQLVVAGPTGG